MQSLGNFSPYYGSRSYINPDIWGQFGEYNTYQSPFFDTQLRDNYPTVPSTARNPAAWSHPSSFSFPNSSPFGDIAPRGRPWSGRDIEPTVIWSRGVSSPCFRHDHHLVIRYSAPPFSAGNWEVDRRHMIEVQFDQLGVASHCRSTWGRMGPWRADRYRFSMDEAYSKLQTEIQMLISRLGLDVSDHVGEHAQRFEGLSPPWGNVNGYGYPLDKSGYVHSAIPRFAVCHRH